MSDEQRLSLPRTVLGAYDLERDAEVLASEHVLALTSSQVGFFHESFFDYAFARYWTSEPRELVAFSSPAIRSSFGGHRCARSCCDCTIRTRLASWARPRPSSRTRIFASTSRTQRSRCCEDCGIRRAPTGG